MADVCLVGTDRDRLNQITPHWQHACKLDAPQFNLLVEVECVFAFRPIRSVLWLWANRICYRAVALLSHQMVLAGGCIMVPPAQIKWYICSTT